MKEIYLYLAGSVPCFRGTLRVLTVNNIIVLIEVYFPLLMILIIIKFIPQYCLKINFHKIIDNNIK